MSLLDFLSPGLAADADGFHPLARSSMERRFRVAGATFEERSGWLVPVYLPGEEEHRSIVGVGDLSHLTKLEVRPAGVPADLVTDRYKAWYDVSPRRALVLCDGGNADDIRRSLDGRLVLDVTAQYGILALVGPEAPALLRRLTHLHHFPSSGDVAHVTAHVLEQDGGYWVVFPQEYGHYLYEVAADCASALGGGPVGVDALGGAA
jgi:glycine cleavage system aminomethyltransferase T